jgi:hypothetical protein
MFDHRPRRITPHGALQAGGWRVKLYAIEGGGRPLPQSLLGTARLLAEGCLPAEARTETRYGEAFVIVHEAAAFNTVVVDWWEQTNELRHHVFRAPSGQASFVEITAGGESVCTWELRIQAFEREAWLAHVLCAETPDFEAYAATQLATEEEA